MNTVREHSHLRGRSTIVLLLMVVGSLASLVVPAKPAYADTVSLEVRPGSLVAMPEEALPGPDIKGAADGKPGIVVSNILVRDGRGNGTGWNMTLSLRATENGTPISGPILLKQQGGSMGEQLLHGSLARTTNTGVVEITIQSR